MLFCPIAVRARIRGADLRYINQRVLIKGGKSSGVISAARGLGITVAAGGIQDSAQQASLIRTGCEQGQGHLYSDAISAEHTLGVIEAGAMGLQLAGR